MKNKLAKYRAEREKNDQKISDLQKRNAQLDELILEEENQEIVAMVRDLKYGPEQLTAVLRELRERNGAPVLIEKTEDDAYEE